MISDSELGIAPRRDAVEIEKEVEQLQNQYSGEGVSSFLRFWMVVERILRFLWWPVGILCVLIVLHTQSSQNVENDRQLKMYLDNRIQAQDTQMQNRLLAQEQELNGRFRALVDRIMELDGLQQKNIDTMGTRIDNQGKFSLNRQTEVDHLSTLLDDSIKNWQDYSDRRKIIVDVLHQITSNMKVMEFVSHFCDAEGKLLVNRPEFSNYKCVTGTGTNQLLQTIDPSRRSFSRETFSNIPKSPSNPEAPSSK